MKLSVRTQWGALLLAVALPMLAAAPAAAAPTTALPAAAPDQNAAAPDQNAVAARTDPGRRVIHSRTVDIGTSASPELATVDCVRGERLIGGGYSTASTDLHVASSFPSYAEGKPTPDGAEPEAWTVGAVNETKLPLELRVSVACLAGGDARVRVATATQTFGDNRFSLTASCPDGTVRAGGGFTSQWERKLGRAAILASYPTGPRGWALDAALIPGDPDVKSRATVTAHAICVGGVDLADALPTTVSLRRGEQTCASFDPDVAASCTVAWSGSIQVRCATGQILSGAGYQASTGDLPGLYPVDVATPVEGAWNLDVRGSTSPNVQAIGVTVTPLCLVAAATPGGGSTGASTGGGTDPNGRDQQLIAAVAGGAGLLVLLLLGVLALHRAGRRRRAASQPVPAAAGPGQPGVPALPGLEVVVRAQRGNYRLSEFREKP